MAWIVAVAGIASTLLNAQQQGQASGASSRAAGLQAASEQAGANFTPTAQAAQQSLAGDSPSSGPEIESLAPPPEPQAPEPASAADGGSLSNINQAAQLGATLQQALQSQRASGENSRAQALAGARPGPAPQYQPTAGARPGPIIGQDPRLQQLFRGY